MNQHTRLNKARTYTVHISWHLCVQAGAYSRVGQNLQHLFSFHAVFAPATVLTRDLFFPAHGQAELTSAAIASRVRRRSPRW